MTDHTREFFDRLGSKPQPLLEQVNGTLRFDVDDRNATTHWFVDVNKGTVAVSERNADADTVVRIHRSLLDRIVTGEANALASALRGQVAIEGDLPLMVAFQRLMPGPPRAATANLDPKGRTS